MKFIDIIILLPLIYGIYQGYTKGLVTMVFELLSIVLGMVLGFKLMQVGIDFLYQFFPSMPKLLPFLSFIIIFTLVLLAVRAIGMAIKAVLDITIFAGIIDNIIGAAVGFLKFLFLISIIVWLVKTSGIIIPESVTKDAVVFQFISQIAPQVVLILETLMPFLKDLFSLIQKQI